MSCYLSRSIVIHFFYQRGWTTANKCNICNRFFIDDSDLGTKFDRAFTITFDDIKNTDISYLMNEVKVNRVIFNLYYVVGNFPHCHGENIGEIFFEVANNLFGLHVVFVQIYLKGFFNLMKPITELVTDKYEKSHHSVIFENV